jgi:hypothetical protein
LIALAAATALAGAVFDAYSSERALSDQPRQELLESQTSTLLADGLLAIAIEPQDLEVILLLKARNLFHPKRAALRIVHAVSIGGSHEHPNVIHESRQPVDDGGYTDSIWKCYHDGESIAPTPGVLPQAYKVPKSIVQVKVLSRSPWGIWAEPVRNRKDQVVGVLALQTYSSFTSREFAAIIGMPAVGFTAIGISVLIVSDY